MSKQILPQRILWLIGSGVAVLVLLLGSAFYRSWNTNRALRSELATLEPMVTAAMIEQQTLQARLAYVQSDEYVESWAQSRARMARPDETLVVLVESTSTPVPYVETPQSTPTPEPVPFWARWWRALRGE